jgi:hypothetical protein
LPLSGSAGKVGGVGLWDRARLVLGLGKGANASEREQPAQASGDGSRRRKKDGRPPLPEVIEGARATIDDALTARAEGKMQAARSILAAIDKGHGLRMVLRAAAALEAGDEEEVLKLLPMVKKEEPAWQLTLQVAATLDRGPERESLVHRATQLGAPAWSLAWLRASSSDDTERRGGLVELLFQDPALARTVAARDLSVPEIKSDNDSIRRYAAFSHGRDIIRRFGPKPLCALLDRASGKTS